MLHFDVVDTGIGIAKESQDKIFQPFSQEDETVTRRFGGTGLGLTISKRIAGLLGGDLTLESESGKGSTFKLTLAAGQYDKLLLQERPTADVNRESTAEESQECDLSHCKVLLVDDGDTNRRLVRIILERVNAAVHEAENGLVACQMTREDDYDIVLLDMQMPVMDGYTAASQMRDDGFEKPIIALTAHAMASDKEKCLSAGCSGYLSKPISRTDLLALISQEVPEPDVDPIDALVAEAKEARGGSSTTIEQTDRSSGEGRSPEVQAAPPLTSASSSPESLVPVELEDEYRCELPTDDAEIREVVVEFISGLPERIEKMQQAIEEEDSEALRQLAHWLKGAGGTVGFDCFTQPAAQLESLAKQGVASDKLSAYVNTLGKITTKLVV